MYSISRYRVSLISLITFCVTSCTGSECFSLDNAINVDIFPVTHLVSDFDDTGIKAIGVQGIYVSDEYIILSSVNASGCISVYDKNGESVTTPFLNVGNGPGEILYQPFLSWCSFDQSERLLMRLFDFKGNFIEYDIDGTISHGRPLWKVLSDSLSISSGARYFCAGKNRLICRRSNAYNTGFDRFIISDSGTQENHAMAILNSYTALEKNILSTMFLYNEKHDKVVEFCSRMNVIHLYSLNNSFNKTITIDGKAKIKDIEQDDILKSSKKYYDAKAFDKCFVGLNIGTNITDLNNGDFESVELHFFDWEGNPLAELLLPVRALYFDIDFDTQNLYLVEYDTDKILRYDLSSFLSSIF